MWTEADLKAWSRGDAIDVRLIVAKNMKAYEAIKNGHDVEAYTMADWNEFDGATDLMLPLRVKRFETWAVVDCSGAATYYRSKPIPSDIPSGSRLVKLGEIDE